MIWKIVIVIIILLIFIPFPVKLRASYCNGVLNIYLFKFRIDIFKFFNKKKKTERKPKKVKKKHFNLKALPSAIHKFNINPFKPTLRVKLVLDYGIDDAAATAIFYGLMNAAAPFVNQALSVLFKIKKYKASVNPEFDKFMFKADMDSIIFISLAKIIYMSIIAFKALKLLKKPAASNFSCNNT